jgi:type I restriction enzyme M protein
MANGKVSQDEINAVAWRACDTFRGTLDPEQYKNYILVFLFLKYLSDLWREKTEAYRREYRNDEERVQRRLQRERFIMPAGCDFYSLYEQRNRTDVGQLINKALLRIEEANLQKLEGVLRYVDFNHEHNLGETKDRNKRLKNLLEDFAHPALDLRPTVVGGEDVIGNTYEYLIARFAGDAGKKGGEFYTPRGVAELLAKLLAPKPGQTICDPACGSGSLLIRVGDEVGGPNYALYGQEMNRSTWALCRMNMFLHGKDSASIAWGDTIQNPKLLAGDALMKFDIVVANPPFSLDKWGVEFAPADPYRRFHRGVPPRSRGDFAFITHMIETAVAGHGKVGVIVPHGVLFRGGAEGRIRQAIVEENLLEAVIGLPANLFFGTGIPAAIMLFNRGKTTSDVLFVDASRGFEDGKNQNRLRPADIDKVLATFRAFKSAPKYAHRATVDQIRGHEFNLNIPRYVDTFEEEAPIDLKAVEKEIEEIEGELAGVRKEMARQLRALGMT